MFQSQVLLNEHLVCRFQLILNHQEQLQEFVLRNLTSIIGSDAFWSLSPTVGFLWMREETLRSSVVSLKTVEFGSLGKVSIFVLSTNPELEISQVMLQIFVCQIASLCFMCISFSFVPHFNIITSLPLYLEKTQKPQMYHLPEDSMLFPNLQPEVWLILIFKSLVKEKHFFFFILNLGHPYSCVD